MHAMQFASLKGSRHDWTQTCYFACIKIVNETTWDAFDVGVHWCLLHCAGAHNPAHRRATWEESRRVTDSSFQSTARCWRFCVISSVVCSCSMWMCDLLVAAVTNQLHRGIQSGTLSATMSLTMSQCLAYCSCNWVLTEFWLWLQCKDKILLYSVLQP